MGTTQFKSAHSSDAFRTRQALKADYFRNNTNFIFSAYFLSENHYTGLIQLYDYKHYLASLKVSALELMQ